MISRDAARGRVPLPFVARILFRTTAFHHLEESYLTRELRPAKSRCARGQLTAIELELVRLCGKRFIEQRSWHYALRSAFFTVANSFSNLVDGESRSITVS